MFSSFFLPFSLTIYFFIVLPFCPILHTLTCILVIILTNSSQFPRKSHVMTTSSQSQILSIACPQVTYLHTAYFIWIKMLTLTNWMSPFYDKKFISLLKFNQVKKVLLTYKYSTCLSFYHYPLNLIV